jgi:hypothetical protein
MWIASFFTENGEPVTGLSPIIGSGMIEKGDGFYAYDFTGYNDTKDYTVRSDSVTLSGTDRYSYGSTGEYNESLNEIKSTVDDIDIRTALIRKIQTNKLELADGDTGNWILYDDDSVTPLLTFDVRDKNGDLIVQPANIPSRRSKGY